MRTMLDINTSSPVEVEDEKVIEHLRTGQYAFSGDTPVMILDKTTGDEDAYMLDPNEAKQWILSGKGRYMSAEAMGQYKEQQKYGSSAYAIPASLMGLANSWTFGAAGAATSAMGLPTEEIERANPGISLASHLVGDIAAMGLTLGALAPVKGAQGIATATKLAKTASEAKSALSILDRAKKLPFHLTGPGMVAKAGFHTKDYFVKKLLGEAGEEVLEKSVGRGLLASMGGMAAEGFLFSAGYGTVDLVEDMYKNRADGTWSPEEAVSAWALHIGIGTGIGVAIPPAFKSLGYIGMKGLNIAGKAAKGSINFATHSGAYEDFMHVLAKRGSKQAMNEWGGLKKQAELKEMLLETRNVDEGLAATSKLVESKEELRNQTADLLESATALDNDINILDNEGHAIEWIEEMLVKSPSEVGVMGAVADQGASTTVMAELALMGNARLNRGVETGTIPVGGFLDTLEDFIVRTLTDGLTIIPKEMEIISGAGYPSGIKINRVRDRLLREYGAQPAEIIGGTVRVRPDAKPRFGLTPDEARTAPVGQKRVTEYDMDAAEAGTFLKKSITDHTGKRKLVYEEGPKPSFVDLPVQRTTQDFLDDKVTFTLESSSREELMSLFDEVQTIRTTIEGWVSGYAKDEVLPSIGASLKADLDWAIGEGDLRQVLGILMNNEAARGALDIRTSALVFSALEKLASRVHAMSIRGTESSVEALKQFRTLFKEQINKFITSDAEWAPIAQETVLGHTPWGVLANAKAYTNSLMTTRDGLYKAVKEEFFEVDPDFLATKDPKMQPSLDKIQSFINDIDHTNTQTKMQVINKLAVTSRELLERLTDPNVYSLPNLGKLNVKELGRFKALYQRRNPVGTVETVAVPKAPTKAPTWAKVDSKFEAAQALVEKANLKDKKGYLKTPSLSFLMKGLNIGNKRAKIIRQQLKEQGVYGPPILDIEAIAAKRIRDNIAKFQSEVNKLEKRLEHTIHWNPGHPDWTKRVAQDKALLEVAEARLNKEVATHGYKLIPKQISKKKKFELKPVETDEAVWKNRIGWEKLDFNQKEAAKRSRDIQLKFPADSEILIVQRAINIEKGLLDRTSYLTGEVAPAMRLAAILEKERNTLSAAENPGLLPYAFGLGIGGLTGGALGEDGFIPGAMTGAAVVGSMRFSQDAMLNPGRAIAKLTTFFNLINGFEEFSNMQVKRYVRWLNYTKETRSKDLLERKVSYEGPGSEIRFPRLFVSSQIARMLTEFGDIDLDPKEEKAKK